MAISVVMPALEMAQETGKLISWLKKEGESVAKGEPLLEIETDKAVMEIESPGDGFLAGVRIEAGAEVPVGQTIAWIVSPGEVPPVDEVAIESGRKTTAVLAASAISTASSANQPATSTPSTQPVKISPKARRYTSPLTIQANTTFFARVLNGNRWSSPSQAAYPAKALDGRSAN